MKIEKIVILTKTSGTDRIWLYTDLPNGCCPYEGNVTFSMEVANGTGIEYIKKNLPGYLVHVVEGVSS